MVRAMQVRTSDPAPLEKNEGIVLLGATLLVKIRVQRLLVAPSASVRGVFRLRSIRLRPRSLAGRRSEVQGESADVAKAC